MTGKKPRVAIVDYGLGNLFSVRSACEQVGLDPVVTQDRREVAGACAVFLPGVGAFGDAMAELSRLRLVDTLRDVALRGTPFIGICLGQQLLMSESYEFGNHRGLGLIEGAVVKFDRPGEEERILKVPQVGWNRIFPPGDDAATWSGTPLEGLSPGFHQYFVHSYHARPADPSVLFAVSNYGHIRFASALRRDNVIAFQFHPERGGPHGLEIYRNLAQWIIGCTQQEK